MKLIPENNPICGHCGKPLRSNGTTKQDPPKHKWRCLECRATFTTVEATPGAVTLFPRTLRQGTFKDTAERMRDYRARKKNERRNKEGSESNPNTEQSSL